VGEIFGFGRLGRLLQSRPHDEAGVDRDGVLGVGCGGGKLAAISRATRGWDESRDERAVALEHDATCEMENTVARGRAFVADCVGAKYFCDGGG